MLDAQNLIENGVERAHCELCGVLLANQLRNTLLHLARGLVGEGQRQNVPRLDARRQQVRDAVGQHAGLARTGARHNQAGALCGLHCGALHVVELVEVIFHHQKVSDGGKLRQKS